MDTTVYVQAILLGIVQGLTEFIPISSSGHLIIIPWLLGWEDWALTSLSFDVSLHLGTLLAVLVYFARDWVRIIRAGIASIIERKIGDDADRRLAWLLIIGTIPGAITGFLAEAKINDWFHKPNAPHESFAMFIMALIIMLLGLAMWIAERIARHTRSLNRLTLKDSIVIGLAQALAIFPGVSRSGSTITAGLALGFERPDAASFAFLLSAPIIVGAGLKSMVEVYHGYQSGQIGQAEFIPFFLGFVAAAISGYMTIRFLLRYLQRNSTDIFVYYRWALAILVIIVAIVRG